MTDGALSGVRVLDIGRLVGGPFAATVLAELGADVVKVEAPGTGDPLRYVGTPVDDRRSCAWLVDARNKRSLTLDLRSEDGRAVLGELVGVADVLIENSRPGWLESIGFDQSTLDELNPRLVTARVSGYGQHGPNSALPGLDRQAVAVSGVATLTGERGGPPLKPGVFVADYTTGLCAATLILAALHHRDHVSGQGQTVDLALYDFPLRMTSDWLPEYQLTGRARPRVGNGTEAVAPSGAFHTSDDVWLMIACSTDGAWERLADVTNFPVEQRGNLREGARRVARRDEVNGHVERWVGALEARTVERLLREQDLPVARFYEPADVLDDEHFIARGSLVEAETGGASVVVPAPAGQLSATPLRVRWSGPPLGEHSDEVLAEWLDMAPQLIAGLHENGVV